MKKTIFGLFVLTITIISCSKDDTSSPAPDSYMSFSAGSKWTYDVINNTGPGAPTTTKDTVTATGTDTSINTTGTARTYHILAHNSGAHDYYNVSGNDYYRYQAFAGLGVNFENLYLKDNAAAAASWPQTITVTVPGIGPVALTVTNAINAKGISKTVNGISYTDVVDVQTTITAAAFPGAVTSNIHSYYARKVGLIEGDYIVSVPLASISVNTTTLLKTAIIL